MQRGIWVHQFNQLGESTAQQIADTLLPRGIDTVYVKAMDGLNWMGDFYTHPLAPTQGRWRGQVVSFAEVGLKLLPWVVNRYASNEAPGHVECGQAAGGLIVDFEYQYDGFWKGTDAEARRYFGYLGESDLWIAVAPDPRQPGRDYDRSMIAGLRSYLPQTYWTDFQRDTIRVLEEAKDRMEGLGPIEPILPYNGTPDDMRRALQWCVQQGYASVSLWRMGTADGAQLDAFAERQAGETDEPPIPVPTDCQGYKDAIERAVNRLQIELGRKTTSGKPAALSKPHIREIQSELFAALQV